MDAVSSHGNEGRLLLYSKALTQTEHPAVSRSFGRLKMSSRSNGYKVGIMIESTDQHQDHNGVHLVHLSRSAGRSKSILLGDRLRVQTYTTQSAYQYIVCSQSSIAKQICRSAAGVLSLRYRQMKVSPIGSQSSDTAGTHVSPS